MTYDTEVAADSPLLYYSGQYDDGVSLGFRPAWRKYNNNSSSFRFSFVYPSWVDPSNVGTPDYTFSDPSAALPGFASLSTGAVEFPSGSTSYAFTFEDLPSTVTFEVWVKVLPDTVIPSGGAWPLFMFDGSGHVQYCLGLSSDLHPVFVFTSMNTTSGGGAELVGNNPVGVGWHHLVGRIGGGNVSLQVDKVTVMLGTATSSALTGWSLDINGGFSGQTLPHWQISHPAVYGTMLSDTRLGVHYDIATTGVSSSGASGTASLTLTGVQLPAWPTSTFLTVPHHNQLVPDPVAGSTRPYHSKWWIYQPVSDEILSLDTFSTEASSISGADTIINVYSGPSPTGAVLVGTNDDAASPPDSAHGLLSQLLVNLSAGVTYHIQVGSYDSAGDGITLYDLNAYRPGTLFSTAPTRGGSVVSDQIATAIEFSVEVLDKTVKRPPSAITVVVGGGAPEQEITFSLDYHNVLDPGTTVMDVYTTTLDSDGSLGPTSLGVTSIYGGEPGVRTVYARQMFNGTNYAATDTYTVERAEALAATSQGPDADPVAVPEAVVNGVRKWVFQDLLPVEDGGIGSYVLPINPADMSSPHVEFNLTSRHTTALTGQFHVFQAGNIPKEWTFSGYCSTEEMYEKLYQYSRLNRRFYVIDHHNRAWKVVFTNLDITPRLRQNVDGEYTDWGQDYTVTAIVVDQDWSVPV